GPITYSVTETDSDNKTTTVTQTATKAPAPAVTISTAPNINQVDQTSVAVAGTGDEGDTITVFVVDGLDGTTAPATTTVSGGAWSVNGIDASGLADGPVT